MRRLCTPWVVVVVAACGGGRADVRHGGDLAPPQTEGLIVADDVAGRLARLAPVEIDVADELIGDELRPALQKLVEAAAVIDELYLAQVSEGNAALRARLAAEPAMADALAYFDVMYGPWDRLAEGEPFVGSERRPEGVTFYPRDLTREAFQGYVEAHPAERDALTSYFTVIRREGDALRAVPYSEAYRDPLERAARLLEEAAAVSSDERLARYLRLRAEAFRTNDYFDSDVAWLELGDGPIEVVIGPYEVYEDQLMNMKASFEAFITIRDPEATAQLQTVSSLAEQLELALPVAEGHRNLERGSTRPIAVAYELVTAGDARAGVQTLAFNLPNDERVREEHGYKLVLLRNVLQAKYDLILVPIAGRLVEPTLLAEMSFEAFLNNTLMHEVAHGLGPGRIRRPDGTQTDVNRELRDLYSTIEEAKADIVGLFCSQWMIQNGHLDRAMERPLYATFLGGFFRSVRFGATEAHGQANVIQFNYLLERGAIRTAGEGRYAIDYGRIREGVSDLARELLAIEGDGDYARARAFVDRYGTPTEELLRGLGTLSGIPVDIRPSYPAAARVLAAR